MSYLTKLSRAKILKHYDLDMGELNELFHIITDFIESHGGQVKRRDLSYVIESNVYEYDKTKLVRDESEHHETAISDGKTIYLHEDLDDVGGYTGRLYDLIHLGLGHFWQWNSKGDYFQFSGDYAWEIGTNFYLGSSEFDLSIAHAYEKEASKIALTQLVKIVQRHPKLDNTFEKNVLWFFNDYLNTDLKYIIRYYRTGIEENFFLRWEYNSRKLRKVNLPERIYPKQRTNKCIPLINIRN